ncbi:colanic acid biosynthesis glycosyltransferase WcaI [Segetibacter sp. 3557_3]|uniref:WcaI family glycosyltransferase n=1 Tax=Segetibacter sp. 3557_3 TaxID=2547429 RepID=UPI001058A84E|nr:WcaI family glycosyltransferase [Segetibacter sp. 3557_3]TDH20822.1 colanic acid biosynthesis glycosyltransferase WcaI [Segetibacter sp. 3557_3]
MQKPPVKKRILLIGGNYFPEPTGIGKYSGEMMDWLATNNYECAVITTFPYYPQWKVEEPYRKDASWYKSELRMPGENASPIKIIRCPHYIPASPSGLTRIISDFSFFFSAFFVVFRLLFAKRYDYVITVAPPFALGLLAIFYKTFKRTKFIYHIQDLQIDAARELEIVKSPALLNVLFAIEKFILKRADRISTISEGMIKKIKNKIDKNILLFPNWVDTTKFTPLHDKTEIKTAYGFLPGDIIFLYSGGIGVKQGLEAILHSAKRFASNTRVKFIICGSGPYKTTLEALKNKLNLQNVVFLPLKPVEELNRFLNLADFHLVIQKANAGDLLLPSKLTTILAVGGISIVTASAGTSLYSIVKENRIGILTEPDNQEALNEVIAKALDGMNEHGTVSINARAYAVQQLSTHTILQGFMQAVEQSQSGAYTKEKLIRA